MINAKSIQYRYTKNSLLLFERLALNINDFGVFGLVGKNGAGKTTLLKILAGLIFPTRGELSVFGFNPRKREAKFLEEIYYIPETFDVPALTIEQYELSYSYFYPKFHHQRFSQIIEECGLTKDRKLTELSHGEKKKVFIAFGLATQCRLLLLDEPTNGLDIPSKSLFKKIISTYASAECIVIIATHQVHDIENIIDHLIMLDSGQIILNESMLTISDKITFTQQFEAPAPNAIYYEKIMGTYVTLNKREQAPETEVNLELLFKALLDRDCNVKQLFGE